MSGYTPRARRRRRRSFKLPKGFRTERGAAGSEVYKPNPIGPLVGERNRKRYT
jgi:hypothetical protein